MIKLTRVLVVALLFLSTINSISRAQDAGLVTRVYPVSRSLFDCIAQDVDAASSNEFVELGQTATLHDDVQTFLEEAGVPFPDGSSARYERIAKTVIVHNTIANHYTLVPLLATCGGPLQVQVEVALVRIEEDALPAISEEELLTSARIAELSQGDAVILESIAVLGRSGVTATTERRTGAGPDSDMTIESSLSATPVVGPDSQTIDVSIAWKSKRGADAASVGLTDSIATSVVVADSTPVLLRARRDGANGHLELATLTVHVLNEKGERLEFTPEGYRTN